MCRRTTDIEKLSGKLDTIQSDLDYIKEHMANIDVVMTEDDLNSLDEAEIEFKVGKTIASINI